jgi:hypothetical protein
MSFGRTQTALELRAGVAIGRATTIAAIVVAARKANTNKDRRVEMCIIHPSQEVLFNCSAMLNKHSSNGSLRRTATNPVPSPQLLPDSGHMG